jgi:uncharacterized membrane protein
MTIEKRGGRERLLGFFRIRSRSEAARTLSGAFLGALFYIALYRLDLPGFRVMGLAAVQIDPAILAIPVAAAFFGPLAGLLAGLIGSFGTDALFTQQVIAMGLINLSYAVLGFVAGIPRYSKGFSTWRALIKVLLFTMAGFALMALIYYGALVYVAGQNTLVTMLYNFLPFFTPSLITLLLLTPVAVRILEALARLVSGKISLRAPGRDSFLTART